MPKSFWGTVKVEPWTPCVRRVTQWWLCRPPRIAQSPRLVSKSPLFHRIWQCLRKDSWVVAGELMIFSDGRIEPPLSGILKLKFFNLAVLLFLLYNLLLWLEQCSHRGERTCLLVCHVLTVGVTSMQLTPLHLLRYVYKRIWNNASIDETSTLQSSVR